METVLRLDHSGQTFAIERDINGTTLCFGDTKWDKVPLGFAYPKRFILAAESAPSDTSAHPFGFNFSYYRPWRGAFKAKDAEWIELRAAFMIEGQPTNERAKTLLFLSGHPLFKPIDNGSEREHDVLPPYIITLRRTEVQQIIRKIDAFSTI